MIYQEKYICVRPTAKVSGVSGLEPMCLELLGWSKLIMSFLSRTELSGVAGLEPKHRTEVSSASGLDRKCPELLGWELHI